jgi:hypothetical protein
MHGMVGILYDMVPVRRLLLSHPPPCIYIYIITYLCYVMLAYLPSPHAGSTVRRSLYSAKAHYIWWEPRRSKRSHTQSIYGALFYIYNNNIYNMHPSQFYHNTYIIFLFKEKNIIYNNRYIFLILLFKWYIIRSQKIYRYIYFMIF